MEPGDALRAVLDDIPVEYQERFAQVWSQPAAPAERIRRDLDLYLATIRLVAAQVDVPIVKEAERVARTCLLLLDTPRAAASPGRELAAAAARYFMTEDEDEEITGVLGLDDDVQVVNAVCRALGRADLCIPWSRPL